MKRKTVVIGIMPQHKIRERTLAIASGTYKSKPSDPKIWFTSLASVAQVLNEENRALLSVIQQTKPESVTQLAQLTGRKLSNLSRTLKTLARYGFVTLEKVGRIIKPEAKVTDFSVVFSAVEPQPV